MQVTGSLLTKSCLGWAVFGTKFSAIWYHNQYHGNY